MALKFASKQAIEQEVRCRLKLDKTKVLPLLRFHVPQDQRDSYISYADGSAGEGGGPDTRCGVEVAVEHSDSANKVSKDGTVLNWVLVMPWADSTLSDEIRNKQIAGTSFDIVKAIMKNVADALQHMHTQK